MKNFLIALVALVSVNAQAGSWEHTKQVGQEVAQLVGLPQVNFIPVNTLHEALGQAVPVQGKCNVKLDNNLFMSDDDNKIAYVIAHEMGHCYYVQTKQATELQGQEFTWYTEYWADGFATQLVNSKFDVIAGAHAALGDTPDEEGHPSAARRYEAMETGNQTYY